MTTTMQAAFEATARQIADDLDNGVLPEGKVIYNGQVMDRVSALHQHNETILAARKSAFYDVQDSIDEFMAQGPAKLRLRSNITWGLGYRVIGALRSVLYGMNEHARESNSVDNFNEFLAELADAKNSADYAEDLGYDHYGVGITKACALYTLYSQWRALAVKEFGIARIRVRDNDLPSLFTLADAPPKYDPSEADKMVVATKMMLEGEEQDVIDEAIALVYEKAHREHADRVAANIDIAPALKALISELREIEGFQFYDLPIDVQGTLITSVLNSSRKIPEQLAKMKSVTTIDMIASMPQLKRLQAKLEDVLSDPRFDA